MRQWLPFHRRSVALKLLAVEAKFWPYTVHRDLNAPSKQLRSKFVHAFLHLWMYGCGIDGMSELYSLTYH